MKSIKTKTVLLTVCTITVAMVIATLLGVVAIRNIGVSSSEQILQLLCQAGEKNLDYYFESVEQSVEMVSSYAESDLDGLALDQMRGHLERVKGIFERMTRKTNGVLTYYYRIDPSVSTSEKGFWFVNLDGTSFQEHKVTDITLYDTEDTSNLVWFTVPKATGEPVWLPPYITDNLDVKVISYNVPIYQGERFIGVIGIEMDYSAMAKQVDSITLYENGYAFINDEEGKLIYHPRIDSAEGTYVVPKGILTDETMVYYTYQGVKKLAAWLPLSNGMRLIVAVPVSEINASWHRWVLEISLVSVLLLLVFILLTMRLSGRLTKPLQELTEAAKRVNEGNYDFALEYSGEDEVGILTRAFSQLSSHLKTYINDLKSLAYGDALTAVRNRSAYNIHMQKLQSQLEEPETEFAVCFFDCNGLKVINDRYGHDKGDVFLKNACAVICQMFAHSPVFRTGGDEFAAVLQNRDYQRRDELLALFDQYCYDLSAAAKHPWERVDIARGMAVYDSTQDSSVNDVVKRADQLMYLDKREKKSAAGSGSASHSEKT